MSQALRITGNPIIHSATQLRALRKPVLAHVSAQVAWARLAREGLAFLVVVEGGGGRMVGIVTRDSLRPGPCCARHGSACSVVNHRIQDGAFCFSDEDLSALQEAEAARAMEYPYPPARSAPLVVVDRRLRPVGFLGPWSASQGEARQTAA